LERKVYSTTQTPDITEKNEKQENLEKMGKMGKTWGIVTFSAYPQQKKGEKLQVEKEKAEVSKTVLEDRAGTKPEGRGL